MIQEFMKVVAWHLRQHTNCTTAGEYRSFDEGVENAQANGYHMCVVFWGEEEVNWVIRESAPCAIELRVLRAIPRGKGHGPPALEAIVYAADSLGITLWLDLAPDHDFSIFKLTKFYVGQGFRFAEEGIPTSWRCLGPTQAQIDESGIETYIRHPINYSPSAPALHPPLRH